MVRRRRFIGFSVLGLVSACSVSPVKRGSSLVINLTISAASSLQDVIQDLGNIYCQQNPHLQLTYNFASSGSLRYQIEQGAPVDVFISAAEQYIDILDRKNLLLKQSRQNLLKNEMVLITSPNNLELDGFVKLQSNAVQKIALGTPESVPAGKYAKEILDFLKLYQSLKSKFVFAKDVRQVLAYVETANVEAGIVYSTDAKISDQVKIIATAPHNSHSPIIYSVAITAESKYPNYAHHFIQFLLSNPAQNIFRRYGFH